MHTVTITCIIGTVDMEALSGSVETHGCSLATTRLDKSSKKDSSIHSVQIEGDETTA